MKEPTRTIKGRRDPAPMSPPKGPEGTIWPHSSFLDWMNKAYPENTNIENQTDRELLIRMAQRAVYLRILKETLRGQMTQTE